MKRSENAKATGRRWYHANRAKELARKKLWDAAHPEAVKRKNKHAVKHNRKRTTGWTPEEYQAAFESQQGAVRHAALTRAD